MCTFRTIDDDVQIAKSFDITQRETPDALIYFIGTASLYLLNLMSQVMLNDNGG